MLTRAPIVKYNARSPSHGFFCGIVYEGIKRVNLTGCSAHHLLLKTAVAIAANAIQHAWVLFK